MIPHVTQRTEEDIIKDFKYYIQKLANKYHYSIVDNTNLTKISNELNDIIESFITANDNILSDSTKEDFINAHMLINNDYMIYRDRYYNLITEETIYTNKDKNISKKQFTRPELNIIKFLDVTFYELARKELSDDIDNLYNKFIKIKEIFDECVERCYYTKEMLEQTKKYDFIVNIGENTFHIKYDNVYREEYTLTKIFS